MKNSYPTIVLSVAVIFILSVVYTIDTANKSGGVNSELHEQITHLTQQQETLLFTLEAQNRRLESIEQSLATNYVSNLDSSQITDSDNQTSTFVEARLEENIITEEIIEQTKYKIFDDLSSSIMTVPQALESPEMNSLPKHEQLKLVSEIIGRYNNGELPR